MGPAPGDSGSGTQLLKAMHSLSPEARDLGEEQTSELTGGHSPRLPQLCKLVSACRSPTSDRCAPLWVAWTSRFTWRARATVPRNAVLAEGDGPGAD